MPRIRDVCECDYAARPSWAPPLGTGACTPKRMSVGSLSPLVRASRRVMVYYIAPVMPFHLAWTASDLSNAVESLGGCWGLSRAQKARFWKFPN